MTTERREPLTEDSPSLRKWKDDEIAWQHEKGGSPFPHAPIPDDMPEDYRQGLCRHYKAICGPVERNLTGKESLFLTVIVVSVIAVCSLAIVVFCDLWVGR